MKFGTYVRLARLHYWGLETNVRVRSLLDGPKTKALLGIVGCLQVGPGDMKGNQFRNCTVTFIQRYSAQDFDPERLRHGDDL